MAQSIIDIYPFPVKDASQFEYNALNKHTNRIRLERLPDDPPVPRDETIRNLQSLPSFADLRIWAAWNPEKNEIVAVGNIVLLRMEENKRLAQFEISVLPEYRHQGLGCRLLREIT